MAFKNYFRDINASKKIEHLIKKYKNKKIILYGLGEYFDEIQDNFDLSKLNIVGVCDLKFAKYKDLNQTKYQAFAPAELTEIDFDIILITAFQEIFILDYLKKEIFKGKHKKIKPILEPNYIDLIKIYFSKNDNYLNY